MPAAFAVRWGVCMEVEWGAVGRIRRVVRPPGALLRQGSASGMITKAVEVVNICDPAIQNSGVMAYEASGEECNGGGQSRVSEAQRRRDGLVA